MIRSMTGFALETAHLTLEGGESITASLSIKSLNARFFEAHCRVPLVFQHLETELIKLLKSKLHRGSIYLCITVADQSVFKGQVTPALPLAKSYVQAIAQIQEVTQLPGSVDLTHFITLNNLFITQEQTLSKESIATIIAATQQVADLLIKEQEREGDSILQDMKERLRIIKAEMTTLTHEAQQLMANKKAMIGQELQNMELDENRLLEIKKAALYVVLDKIDLHEEINRFTTHLHNLENQLHASTIEKGKKLDFTLQELNREISTITAKCNHATISTHAINIKVEIEKIREQAQNLV